MASAAVHSERLEMIGQLQENGKGRSIQNNMMQLTLEQLPGIVELVEQNWKAESCRSFEDLVVAYVCFEGNPFEKLKESKLARAAVVSAAASATDCEKILFEEEEACRVCDSWFGGEVFSAFDRFQEIMQCSSAAVRGAYLTQLANPQSDTTDVKLMRMNITELREAYRTAWQSADVGMKAGVQLGLAKSCAGMANAAVKADNSTRSTSGDTGNRQEHSGIQTGDISLSCKVCNKSFVFTVQNQASNKARGYNNMPTKCEEHRTPGLCDQFSKDGNCSYGDACKFQHRQSQAEQSGSSQTAGGTRSSFDQLLPGSISRVCTFFDAGTCHKGDNCPYTHTGNEQKREAQALRIEQPRKAESGAEQVVYGRNGLTPP